MNALEKLRKLNSLPFLTAANENIARLKRTVRPVSPIITRGLIVCTFVEDAIRTLWEVNSQVSFFSSSLGFPRYLAFWMILTSAAVGLIASFLFMIPRTEGVGAKTLVAIVVYQQIIYGRHSAITAGNLGFLIRNACLLGSLGLSLTVPKTAPEPGLPGAVARVRKTMRDNFALAVRILFGLAVLEMFDAVGWGWGFIMIPVCIALLFGYQAEICALVLMIFYVVGACVANPFWTIHSSNAELGHMRELMRYELLQSISILGGLFMMMMSGPGAISVDSKLSQGKAW